MSDVVFWAGCSSWAPLLSMGAGGSSSGVQDFLLCTSYLWEKSGESNSVHGDSKRVLNPIGGTVNCTVLCDMSPGRWVLPSTRQYVTHTW